MAGWPCRRLIRVSRPRTLAALRGKPYADLAFAVLSQFITTLPPTICARSSIGRTPPRCLAIREITPLTTLEPGLHLLHLSNGPTLAFKDVALQLLGNLFEHVLRDSARTLNILGATSGDTGSSAEYAMRGKRNLAVFMLSPHGRMSEFQQAQMYALDDPNIHNLAIEGTFDDCQDIVKAIAADAAFKRAHLLGAVNSINWARIAAQVVYYFAGYFAATSSNDEPVSFAVPSGNFGNVLAGHVAKQMGLPIAQLIVATNENDVLDEFFRTGRYRPRSAAETHATSSPSMDISQVHRTSSASCSTSPGAIRTRWRSFGARSRASASSTSPLRRCGRASARPASFPGTARMPAASRRSATSIGATAWSSIRTRRTASTSAARAASPACRSSASRPRCPRSSRRRFARRSASSRARPAAFADLETRPQHCTVLAADADRVKAFVAANVHAGG